jgi:hypothetical protein
MRMHAIASASEVSFLVAHPGERGNRAFPDMNAPVWHLWRIRPRITPFRIRDGGRLRTNRRDPECENHVETRPRPLARTEASLRDEDEAKCGTHPGSDRNPFRCSQLPSSEMRPFGSGCSSRLGQARGNATGCKTTQTYGLQHHCVKQILPTNSVPEPLQRLQILGERGFNRPRSSA